MSKETELNEKIERARRLAKALTDPADRDRLLAMANDYQRQMDASESSGEQTDATSTTASEAARSDAVVSQDDTGSSDATASPDEEPTTGTGEQPETD